MKKEEKTKLTDIEASEASEKPEMEELSQNDSEKLGEEGTKESSSTATPKSSNKDKSNPWLKYVITAAILAVFTVFVAWVQGGFVETNPKMRLAHWGDAFGIPGILAICFGLLVLASNGGTFDMLAYGARRFFGLFRKNPIDRKYSTFYDYRKSRKEKKRSFWYMVIVGGVYVAVSVVLFVIYFKM